MLFLYACITNCQHSKHTQAGEKRVDLHGCVGCDKKVWGPDDNEIVCNFCGGNRYDSNGKPKECIIHFPLKARLESLLRCPQYLEAVRCEFERDKNNDDYITGYIQGFQCRDIFTV